MKQMMTDPDLLRQFSEERAESAFAELVRRRIDFVYAAALRQLAGDAHRAADVTQEVFLDLARKAGTLKNHPELLGWLFTSTHFAALNAIRAEQRRRRRETEAHAMHDAGPISDLESAAWEEVRPALDAALHELNERDRRIVLLRFFAQESFAGIAQALGLTENAAQKSATRALDRLRAALVRRGITSTSTALSAVLTAHAHITAPAHLALQISNAAIAGAVTSIGGAAALASFFSVMNTTKIVAGLATLCAGVAVGFVFREQRRADAAAAELASHTRAQVALESQVHALKDRADTAEHRAQAADADNAALLQAVAKTAAAKAPAKPPRKDYAAMPRETALAEVAAMISQAEEKARSAPGYKTYQPPDESQLPESQRRAVEQARAATLKRNRHYYFAVRDDGGILHIEAPSLAGSPATKQFPQLTRDDWLQFEERYARAIAEWSIADGLPKTNAQIAGGKANAK